MSDDDSEEERTQLNVEVDDPDETADRSRALAKAMGVLPSEAEGEGSTLMADPERMRRLAEQAASDAPDQDEPASIVSFVSNVSVVTQSFEAPSPIGGPLPADVEPSTMGSITLDPASRAPADGDPITIEPRMGVRGMMSGPKPARSPLGSDVDTGAQKLAIQEDVSTATVPHAEIVRSVAATDPAAAARLAKSPPRPAGKDVKSLPKRSKTVIGLAPPAGESDVDAKEAETQSDVRVGTLPLGPATEPLPTAPLPARTPMRERTNSEEALIAHALAIPETGGEFKPSTFQPLPDMPPKTLAIPQTPAMASPAVPQPPGSNPATPEASRAPGSSPGIVQPDGPTPAGMVFENLAPPEPKPKSNAGMIAGFLFAGVVLLGAGTALGWMLRSARIPATTTTATAPPPQASASATASASAEPDKKDEEKKEPAVEAKADPEPEKSEPPAAEKPEKTETAKKPKTPPWKPAATKPPPWKPAASPKPSAKPVAVPAPAPAPTPTQPKGFDPGGI